MLFHYMKYCMILSAAMGFSKILGEENEKSHLWSRRIWKETV